MNQENKWEGEERRGLPLHILTYIDERLEANTDEIERKLESIKASIQALNQSVASWMEKQPEICSTKRCEVIEKCEKLIDEAIPTHPDNPDATPIEKRKEHRKAHASWIHKVNEEMDEWRRLRQRIREWGTLGILSVIVIAVWQYLLQGPK